MGESEVLRPLRRPQRLRRGDRVAFVAPSGPVDPLLLARGVELFTGLGMEVSLGAHVGDRCGYLAGDDAARAADLTEAWCDPSVRAVVCVRGGWGAARMVDHLDWTRMAARNEESGPPVFLGASDVTTLHLAIARHLGVATLFAPMPAAGPLARADPEPATLAHLVATLTDPASVQRLGGAGVRALCPGTARGVSLGGTLTLLSASLGTPEAVSASGAVLVLEDVNEEPYRLDRALTQLLRSGAMDGVAAVVAGDWTDCAPAEVVDALLVERLAPLGVPVLAGCSLGHGPVQTTFPLGVEVLVDAAAGTVDLIEPALR